MMRENSNVTGAIHTSQELFVWVRHCTDFSTQSSISQLPRLNQAQYAVFKNKKEAESTGYLIFPYSKLVNLISHHWQMLRSRRENGFFNFT